MAELKVWWPWRCIRCKKYLASFQSELRSKFLPGGGCTSNFLPAGKGIFLPRKEKDVAAPCKKVAAGVKSVGELQKGENCNLLQFVVSSLSYNHHHDHDHRHHHHQNPYHNLVCKSSSSLCHCYHHSHHNIIRKCSQCSWWKQIAMALVIIIIIVMTIKKTGKIVMIITMNMIMTTNYDYYHHKHDDYGGHY